MNIKIEGQIAQSVEQWTENPCVGGSIPSLPTLIRGITECLFFILDLKIHVPRETGVPSLPTLIKGKTECLFFILKRFSFELPRALARGKINPNWIGFSHIINPFCMAKTMCIDYTNHYLKVVAKFPYRHSRTVNCRNKIIPIFYLKIL